MNTTHVILWRLQQVVLLLILGCSALTCGAVAQSAGDATKVVQSFQATLQDVMRHAEALGYQGRYDRLQPVLKGTHDLPTLARVAVGRTWRKLDEHQQAELIETFSDYSTATYAHRFNGFSGEQFRLQGQHETDRGEIVVNTVLVKADGEEIQLDYLMRRRGDQWLITNVIVDGVSDLALKRSEYNAVIRQDGFEALLARLREKIASYATSSP